jgi:hypothetical protein
MTAKNERQHSLDDVLAAIRDLGDVPVGDQLRDWLTRYPAFSREIVDYVTARIDEETRAPSAEASSDMVNRVVSRTMSRVVQLLDADARPQTIQDLSAEIVAAGHSLESFQRTLGIDDSIMLSLAERLVRPHTIPARIVRDTAEGLYRSLDAVRQYFLQGPQLATANKARTKPTARQVDFSYLVEHSTLPEPERVKWLAEVPDPVLQE